MAPTLHVYTFKDGLLARLAHDLRLGVRRFEVRLAEGRVEARFEPGSARVDGVVHGERIDSDGLSDKDKRTIEATIREPILGSGPVTFAGTVAADGRRVDGTLTIRGRSGGVSVPVIARAGELVVDVEIVPSRWGVEPYRALAGAIRLQDRWRARLTLPWDGGPVGNATRTWESVG